MELKNPEHLEEILKRAGSFDQIEFEIGCGNGHFISSFALAHQDRYFIGVELKKSRCIKILNKLEIAGISNVEVVFGKAENLLEHLPRESLDSIRIYFPDPWPKTKHRKKRLLRKPIIDIIASTLKPGGRLCFATDFFDYSVQVKFLVLLSESFSISLNEPPDEVFQSVFAQRFQNAQKPIYFIDAIKTDGERNQG
jgi:tRNA (guanine-N7-)-methyltransferase